MGKNHNFNEETGFEPMLCLDADRDLRLPPNAVVSPCCDDPRNTRTSSISNSSHHSNHQPHHQAKPSSKFGPSPKSKQSSPAYSTHSNNSSTNNKRDSPSGFEPILAPREKTKCVPKKVMKPIVGNASMTNSGVKTPDIDTSKAPVPTTNGVGSNMEEQCNSCSCFYHQGNFLFINTTGIQISGTLLISAATSMLKEADSPTSKRTMNHYLYNLHQFVHTVQ